MTTVESIAAIVSSAIGIFFGALLISPDFRRWLKGNRITYYFQRQTNLKGLKSEVYQTSAKLRTDNDLQDFCHRNGYDVVGLRLELNQGVFRQRSAIYGGGVPMRWKITRTGKDISDVAGNPDVDWVKLNDCQGLPVETALQLINTYPSLQAMLDRIEELEKASVEPLAALRALDNKMLDDKRRFRSPAAKEIHANIRFALREIFVSGITSNPTKPVAVWMERFEKPEAKVIR